MDADGSNMVKLTDDTEKLNSPAWSPDGSKIIFGGPVDKGDIWVTNADGSKIAFVSQRNESKNNFFVMNADGSNMINLTNKPGDYWEPAWSPDGSKIAFVSAGAEEKFDIWIMDADGSNQINLTGN